VTTVILVMIGILIAAAAAAMVVWFGGDAFGRTGDAVRASQLLNAGQNVLSAYQIYIAQNGTEPTSYADLTATRQYLADRPTIPSDLGTVQDQWQSMSGSGDSFAVTGVPQVVCQRVNRALRDDEGIPTTVQKAMGCMEHGGTNVFYVRLKGGG